MYRRNRHRRKARWQNRASMRKEERLAPSITSTIDSHLREKKFVESILPVSTWKIETARFDIHKPSNPDSMKWEYQDGNQNGFYNLKAYILHRDGYQCQKCKTKKGKLHVHHIVFRSNGGTDTPSNLITLCESCHDKLHLGEFKLKSVRHKTKYAAEIGVVTSQLKKQFGDFEETYGYETKWKRDQILQLAKTHFYDAVAICCEEGEIVDVSQLFTLKNMSLQVIINKRRASVQIGLRKFDFIQTPKGRGFVKGKRSTGFFAISDLDGTTINPSVHVKKECVRLSARTTTLTERRMAHPSAGQAPAVSCS